MRFLIVPGTVRTGRKSIHAARYVQEVLEERGHDVTLFDMAEHDIPLMETRRYTDPGEPPDDVERFGQAVESADGIVLVTPEYNHSVPGALKTLLDYLYPEYESMPFSFVTVSAGPWGGVRAHQDLNNIVLELQGQPGPSLPVRNVGDVFDTDTGDLLDDAYAERFQDFVENVEDHTERFA